MAWHAMVSHLLAHAFLDGFLILGLGSLAVYCCRQPVRRHNQVEVHMDRSLKVLVAPTTGPLALLLGTVRPVTADEPD
jgi:NADH:ubiquinone oxidoreductase subunit 5 (subunit L)/multisubunit Na+/H+ antiporter MnhA subunit